MCYRGHSISLEMSSVIHRDQTLLGHVSWELPTLSFEIYVLIGDLHCANLNASWCPSMSQCLCFLPNWCGSEKSEFPANTWICPWKAEDLITCSFPVRKFRLHQPVNAFPCSSCCFSSVNTVRKPRLTGEVASCYRLQRQSTQGCTVGVHAMFGVITLLVGRTVMQLYGCVDAVVGFSSLF